MWCPLLTAVLRTILMCRCAVLKALRSMIGGYSNLERTTDQFQNNNAHIVSVLEAAQAAANASNGGFEVSWAQGVQVNSLDTTGIASAVAAAQDADVAIVVVGDSAEGVGYDGRCVIACTARLCAQRECNTAALLHCVVALLTVWLLYGRSAVLYGCCTSYDGTLEGLAVTMLWPCVWWWWWR